MHEILLKVVPIVEKAHIEIEKDDLKHSNRSQHFWMFFFHSIMQWRT